MKVDRRARKGLFGERTWNDVRSVVTTRMRRKFPRGKQEDIEDAVSLGMVDLVDYWMQLESSIVSDDPGRTFWQACKRGTWMATTFLTQEWDMKDVPMEALSGSEGEDGAAPGSPLAAVPSPEDIIIGK